MGLFDRTRREKKGHIPDHPWDAVNAPVAPRFQVGLPWRRVTEQRRYAS